MKNLYCPSCGSKQEGKIVGSVPYARNAIESRWLLNCDDCGAMYDIFLTGKLTRV